MQANEIWSGNRYALSKYGFKGDIPLDCREVIVKRVFQKFKGYNSRKTTYVEVYKPDERDNCFTVEARRIVDHWSDYVDYRDSKLEATKRREFERTLINKFEEYVNKMIRDALIDRAGLPAISVTRYATRVSVNFSLDKLLAELELDLPEYEEFKVAATKEYESTLAVRSN